MSDQVPESGEAAISPSVNKSGRVGIGCLVLFFGFFMLMGGGLTYGMFVRPVMKVRGAKNWKEAPCEIISSELKTNHDSDGNTYRIEVSFKFDVAGRQVRGDRYSFATGSNNFGVEGKRKVVASLPPGTKTVCYYDPRDPTTAVLNRDLNNEIWFGLFPLIFFLVGLVGVSFALRFWLKAKETDGANQGTSNSFLPLSSSSATTTPTIGNPSDTMHNNNPLSAMPSGPITLAPATSPRGKFIGLVIFALFWNGIISIFVFQAIQGFRNGRPEWFLALFMIPFVLIGLGLILGAVHAGLALFNPRPVLTISSSSVRLGDEMEVAWRFEGNVHVLQRLQIFLEGNEESRYRRGTSTYTDSSTFCRVSLIDSTDSLQFAKGSTRVTMPRDTMHSWDGGNNKIIWTLRLTGEIKRWPDINESYPFAVWPLTLESIASAILDEPV